MVRRILVAAAGIAAVAALTPTAHAAEPATTIGCPPGTYLQWSGFYDPRTGNRLMVCFINLPPI